VLNTITLTRCTFFQCIDWHNRPLDEKHRPYIPPRAILWKSKHRSYVQSISNQNIFQMYSIVSLCGNQNSVKMYNLVAMKTIHMFIQGAIVSINTTLKNVQRSSTLQSSICITWCRLAAIKSSSINRSECHIVVIVHMSNQLPPFKMWKYCL
jgi:hypothetical protein